MHASPRLVLLGTGTAIPQADRGPTAGLLQSGSANILIDAGSGTLQKLAAQGVHPLALDAVFLTHAHLDHLADLLPLAFALAIPGVHRDAPLVVHLSRPALALWRRLQDALGNWLQPPDTHLRFEILNAPGAYTFRDVRIRTSPVQHHASSIGFRFTLPNGAALAWPGDTAPCDALPALLQDADLAVLECSVPDGVDVPGHLNPTSLVDVLRVAPPRQVAVVHRYPVILACTDVEPWLVDNAPCSVTFPNDGHVFPLSPP